MVGVCGRYREEERRGGERRVEERKGEERKETHRVLVITSEKKRTLGRPRGIWEEILKRNFNKQDCGGWRHRLD
jgi:hypothetical protein